MKLLKAPHGYMLASLGFLIAACMFLIGGNTAFFIMYMSLALLFFTIGLNQARP